MIGIRGAIRRRTSPEGGIVVILLTIMVVALFTVVAVVIDIGAARSEKRDLQRVSDLAALAGGPQFPVRPRLGCQDAWNYVRANITDLPAGATMNCNAFPSACVTEVITPPVRVDAANAGKYQVSFIHPVLNADSATNVSDPDMKLDLPVQTNDGGPCERFRVRIHRTDDTLFGSVVGQHKLSPRASAVVRSLLGRTEPSLVALLMLEPWGCDVLVASGQAEVRVKQSNDGAVSGHVTIDSIGAGPNNPAQTTVPAGETICSNSAPFVIDAKGNQNSKIIADPTAGGNAPAIELYALARGQFNCTGPGNPYACEQGDVNDGRLSPMPERAKVQVTKIVVEHVFNCKPSYPNYHGLLILPCPSSGPLTDFRDDLEAAIGDGGIPNPSNLFGTPPPYDRFQGRGFNCTVGSGQFMVVPAGNWFVDCPNPHGLRVQGTAVFLGGNIVFQDKVQVLSQGSLSFNTANPYTMPAECMARIQDCALHSSPEHAYIYMRNGSLEKSAQGSLTINNMHVFLDNSINQTCSNSQMCIGAGSGLVSWTAPTAGPYNKLALWAESGLPVNIGGQANIQMTGVFYAPEATIFYTGQGCQFSFAAQFISRRMDVGGQGCLILEPDPGRIVPVPAVGAGLIR